MFSDIAGKFVIFSMNILIIFIHTSKLNILILLKILINTILKLLDFKIDFTISSISDLLYFSSILKSGKEYK